MNGSVLMYMFGLFSAMFAFGAICWWAYRPANKARFEQDANLVLDTDPVYQNRNQTGDKSE